MFKQYIALTKPGIVLGNLVSAAGGYLLAARGAADWGQGGLVMLGVSLVVASGCTVNNVVDRDIDRLMARTRKRPMPCGRIRIAHALAFAAMLGAAGAGVLWTASGWLPVALVLLGYLVYAGIYTLGLKRRSVHGTLVGSLSGAMPPVAAYCAASGALDVTALALLLIFSLWQMAHSYAIAIVRADDYRAAGIPVLPLVQGPASARRHILVYMAAFTAAALLPWATGAAGRLYGAAALACGLGWLCVGLRLPGAEGDVAWARRIFQASLVVVMLLCAAMAVATP